MKSEEGNANFLVLISLWLYKRMYAFRKYIHKQFGGKGIVSLISQFRKNVCMYG